jgi:hypothetical protein
VRPRRRGRRAVCGSCGAPDPRRRCSNTAAEPRSASAPLRAAACCPCLTRCRCRHGVGARPLHLLLRASEAGRRARCASCLAGSRRRLRGCAALAACACSLQPQQPMAAPRCSRLLARGCMLTGLAERHAGCAMAVVQRAPLIEAPRVAGSGEAARCCGGQQQRRSTARGRQEHRAHEVAASERAMPAALPGDPIALARALSDVRRVHQLDSARCRQHISGNRGADKPTACLTAGRAAPTL